MRFEAIIFKYAEHGLLNYNKKTSEAYKYYKMLNSILDKYEGGYIFVPDHWIGRASVPFYLVNDKNREKLVIADKIPKMNSIMNRLFYEIKSVHLIKKKKISYILNVFSKDSKLRHLNEYRKIILKAKLINLEDEFRGGYAVCSNEYKDLGLTYKDVYEDSRRYDESTEKEDKIYYCKATFSDYVFIRDFVNAEKWYVKLNELIDEDKERLLYSNYWNEIINYINFLRDKVSGTDHIIVNWIDGLRYSNLCKMEFLSKKADRGISFDKMYTSTPYTSATMSTIITGKYLIDDDLYKVKVTDYGREDRLNNAVLLNYLRESGYDFRYLGADFIGDIFSSDSPCEYGYKFMIPGNRNLVPSTIYQFLALEELAYSNKKCLLIIHNLPEAHNFLNPRYESKWDISTHLQFFELNDNEKEKYILNGLEYMDEQLNYYSLLYSNIRCRIYMSDHGNFYGGDDYGIEKLCHVPFFIISKRIEADVIKSVYSLAEFPEIVKMILENKLELEKDNPDRFALIQMDDGYHLGVEFLKNRANQFRYLQCRGVVTRSDAFLKYQCGRSYYEINGQEAGLDCDLAERISYLSKMAGDKFIDINKEKKYKRARSNYKELKRQGYLKDISLIKR